MHTGLSIEKRNRAHAGLSEGTGCEVIPRKGPADRRALPGFLTPALIALLVLLVWLNEVYDLPSLFFGAPPTPFNWQESLLETLLAVLIALAFHAFASRLKAERSRERQRAEKTVKASDYQYRSFVRNLNGVTYHLDADLRPVFVHGDLQRLTGYRDADFMNGSVHWEDIVFTEDMPGFLDHMNKAGTLPGYSVEHSYRIVRKDGTLRWVSEYASTICDDSGRPLAFQGIVHDITPAREAEEALRQSEETYRTIFESTGTAMVIMNENTTIELANSEFEHLSGYSKEALEAKKSLGDFIARQDIGRLLEHDHGTGAAGEAIPKSFGLQFRDHEGAFKDMYVTAAPVPGTEKILLSLLNITEAKKAARELELSREQLLNLRRQSQDVRERERTRVAREIHDELGQLLTALKIDLSLLARKLPPSLPALKTKVESMTGIMDMSIESVQRITMDLRPGLLDDLGLVAAMRSQAEDFEKRTGIMCILRVDPEDIPLRPDQSISVFRIFQETLTNVARHAQATEVLVTVAVSGGILEMAVKDNGVGIGEEQARNPKSYGLMGIRERAYFCGGAAAITGEKGRGTAVIVSIPLDNARAHDDTSACG
jgi:PAS domain S-box-containing protein